MSTQRLGTEPETAETAELPQDAFAQVVLAYPTNGEEPAR